MKDIINEIPASAIVTIYSEDLEEEFVNGFIVASDEKELVLACIDHFGENNGFLLFELEGIYRIDFESDYENKLKYLYLKKGETHEKVNFSDGEESLKNKLLRWAYEKEKVVIISFWDSDSEICGYIKDLEKFKIQKIDQYECKPGQGNSYVSLGNIRCVWVDERRARDSGMIYKQEVK